MSDMRDIRDKVEIQKVKLKRLTQIDAKEYFPDLYPTDIILFKLIANKRYYFGTFVKRYVERRSGKYKEYVLLKLTLASSKELTTTHIELTYDIVDHFEIIR